MLDHRSVCLHGRDIAYVVGGEGPTLLLIHGIGGDWRTWEPVLDGLALNHHVVAVDLPGHGGSDEGPRGLLARDARQRAARPQRCART